MAIALGIGGLSLAVPKRPGLVAFYSTFNPGKFTGNLREVFLQAPRHPDHSFVWLTNSVDTANRVSAHGKAQRYSVFPLWTLLRAEKIVLDNIAPQLCYGRLRLFQLWHGTGFKNIGLLNERRTGLRRFILRRHYQKAEMVLASSAEDAARKQAAFFNGNTVVAGSPRNDRLLATPEEAARRRAAFGIESGKEIIAYCPTFPEGGRPNPFTPSFWSEFDRKLEARNAVFLVKKHPQDRELAVPPSLTSILDVSGKNEDVQDLLSIADVLVTDYSAISTDFVLTGRPVVFYTYDHETYERDSRSFYYDLADVLPGPFAVNEHELANMVLDRAWFGKPEYQARYSVFRNRFHAYMDAEAAGRVADLIVKA